MTRVANPFRYQFRQPANTTSAILRLSFGNKKYYIVKAKTPYSTINSISMELDRRMRLGVDDEHQYEKIVRYILKARVGMFYVDVLFESEDPLALLKEEQKWLDKCKNDEECLNKTFEAYFAKSWMDDNVKKKFDSWMKKKTSLVKNKKLNAVTKSTKNNKALPARRSAGEKSSVPNPERRGARVRSKATDTSSVKEKPKGNNKKQANR